MRDAADTTSVGTAVQEILAWLRSGRRSIVLLSSDRAASADALDQLSGSLSQTHSVVRLDGCIGHEEVGPALCSALELGDGHPERLVLELAARRAQSGSGVVVLVDQGESLPAASAARLQYLTSASGGAVRVVAAADPTHPVSSVLRGLGLGSEFVALHDALSAAPLGAKPPRSLAPRRIAVPVGAAVAAAMIGALLTLPDYGLDSRDPLPAPELASAAPTLSELARLEEIQLLDEPALPAVSAAAPQPLPIEPAPQEPMVSPVEPTPEELAWAAGPASPPPLALAEAVSPAAPVRAAPPEGFIGEPAVAPPASAPPPASPPRRVASLPRRAPAPPVAPARVPVVVNAYPEATIEVDGVSLGTTPVVRAPVEPGVRRFTALFPGGRREVREVDVTGKELFLVFQ